jgi:hypothetical protein
MKRNIRSAAIILILVLSLSAALATAGNDTFDLPNDAKALLPATADAVLAVSSLEDLDQLWQDLLPDSSDLIEGFPAYLMEGFDPEFIKQVDKEKPFLIVLSLQEGMGENPFYETRLVAMKDKNLDVESLPGLEEFHIAREGRYLALSTNPNWTPAPDQPLWADKLKGGLVSATLDLGRVIETFGFMIEMGLAQLEAPGNESAADDPSLEANQAMAKMVRALLNSSEGIDFTLTEKGDTVAKDFVYRTNPGSELAPGPQPSFDEALELTRFLPGGENLLSVSAIDQAKQMEIYRDYYLATLHSTMALMEPAVAQKYTEWYADYLSIMEVSFAPTAMTLRLEQDNSSFQNIIKSDNPQEDWNRLVDLANRMNGLGVGLDLKPLEVPSFQDHEIAGWSMTWNEDELDRLLTADPSLPLSDPLMSSNLITMVRFLPGNIYFSRVDDMLLYCGGPNPRMMEELIGKAIEGKGKVDPRLKKVNKKRGGHVQSATVGDLNALFAVIMEVLEEMGDGEEFPVITDQPLPFLQTLEIHGGAYQIHMEMEKPAIRTLVKSVLELDQE